MSAIHKIVAPAVPDLPSASWTNGWRIGDEIVLSGMTAHPARSRRWSRPPAGTGTTSPRPSST
jgi:2-iminobutanoate/2-iminopropanoate deaminase